MNINYQLVVVILKVLVICYPYIIIPAAHLVPVHADPVMPSLVDYFVVCGLNSDLEKEVNEGMWSICNGTNILQ